ncbi:fluoride efflux transporter CrcB [Sphingomonas sp. RHCKR7]|uniref:fluoride efflux transporter CrcB n=1 Tax=Sphingomonas folli TaxID=2862497 RepID=UPI001CA49A9B|nr:fluoride efflux transporter CrcB [Sphingomonas folli]MBW6527544.1 fluoride efflux transporter CrcB [Sphingomonas folli]
MNSLFLVMAGGAVGTAGRYLTGRAMTAALGPGWPWGTLTVNLVGGLLMGLLVGALARTGGSDQWRLLLGVGALGGFTTFSAFALDAAAMIQRGAALGALGYALVSVVGAIAAVFAGLALVRVAA